jgi:tripartite ATP-independent transporter DctP family solute receptor
MHSLSRRKFLPMVGALSALPMITPLTWAADTPEFRMRFAHNAPVNHPLHVYWSKACDKIKEESAGRIVLDVFPNNQLGGDTEMLSQLRSGAIQFQGLSTTVLSNLVPLSALPGVGFAWNNYDALWRGMDGELGAHLRTTISKAGLVPMERIYDNGFRQLTTSTRPIVSAQDLKGLKIRVPVTPLLVSLFKYLESAPTPINWSDTYMSLQTKVVDGQENPLTQVVFGKLYEVQKHCALTGHAWDGIWVLAGGRAWNTLPDKLKEIVARNFNEQAMQQRLHVSHLVEAQIKELQSKGMSFSKPDISSFKAQLRNSGFYTNWKQKFGNEAWAMLEKYAGQLV